jgi:RNA:NAD 2'-phosphotransferase (TPT1/KptA family)
LLQECEGAVFRDPCFNVGGLEGTTNTPTQHVPKPKWFGEVLFDHWKAEAPSYRIGDLNHFSPEALAAVGLRVPPYPKVFKNVKDIAIALRHTICTGNYGLNMDSGGWVEVYDIFKSYRISSEELWGCVYHNDKQWLRFAVCGYSAGRLGDGSLSAAQEEWCRQHGMQEFIQQEKHAVSVISGHSIPWIDHGRALGPLTESIASKITCFAHGTTLKALTSILIHGLRPGGLDTARRHDHVSPSFPWVPRCSAMLRKDSECYLLATPDEVLNSYGNSFNVNAKEFC